MISFQFFQAIIKPKLFNKIEFHSTAISIDYLYHPKIHVIPYFINGNINRPNPIYASFKRIKSVSMIMSFDKYSDKNLELFHKASVVIDWLLISDEIITEISETQRDKLKRLQVSELTLCTYEISISNESVEVIDAINPSSVIIKSFNCSFDNLNLSLSLNSPNIKFEFNNKKKHQWWN